MFTKFMASHNTYKQQQQRIAATSRSSQTLDQETTPYLTDGRAHGLKVLLRLGVETEGAAGVHAAEGHLSGVLTVERLDRPGEESE